MQTSFEAIDYVCQDAIATLTLRRPRTRNAIDAVMRQELAQAVSALRRDRSVRVLILCGADGSFCSGGDIASMVDDTSVEQARERMVSLQGIVRDLLTLDRPVIAAVDGPAYGAGLGLALTADIILASPRARFCLSFLRLGALPDCGVFYTLPRLVGTRLAKELAFSTREFGAQEAKEMGLVNAVWPQDELDARAQEWARQLADYPPAAVAMTKKIFDASMGASLDTLLEMEAMGQGIARSSEQHRRAVAHFLAGRRPSAGAATPAATPVGGGHPSSTHRLQS